jgi:hypothetical protein
MSEPVQHLPSKPPPNGMSSVLTSLAHSTDRGVQFGTLALIALSGFGNWFVTLNSGDRNRQEIEINRRVAWEGEQRIKAEVVRQVADIHNWVRESTDEFHKGNEDSAANRKMLADLVKIDQELEKTEKRLLASLDNQTRMLENQGQMLDNQAQGVKSLQKIVQEFGQQKSSP